MRRAMAAYARQAKDTELVEWATEIKVMAERRAGELLAAMSESGQRVTRGGDRAAEAKSQTTTLHDLAFAAPQSHDR